MSTRGCPPEPLALQGSPRARVHKEPAYSPASGHHEACMCVRPIAVLPTPKGHCGLYALSPAVPEAALEAGAAH